MTSKLFALNSHFALYTIRAYTLTGWSCSILIISDIRLHSTCMCRVFVFNRSPVNTYFPRNSKKLLHLPTRKREHKTLRNESMQQSAIVLNGPDFNVTPPHVVAHEYVWPRIQICLDVHVHRRPNVRLALIKVCLWYLLATWTIQLITGKSDIPSCVCSRVFFQESTWQHTAVAMVTLTNSCDVIGDGSYYVIVYYTLYHYMREMPFLWTVRI